MSALLKPTVLFISLKYHMKRCLRLYDHFYGLPWLYIDQRILMGVEPEDKFMKGEGKELLKIQVSSIDTFADQKRNPYALLANPINSKRF